jgi:hypothetical protein
MVVELSKNIKPKKLNVDKIRQNILNALRREGKIIARELDKTTATWQGEKPKFEVLIGLTRPPGSATLIVGPTGSDKAVNKWVWTDQGTRPHIIRPKRAKKLVFKSGFSPKTKPKTIASFPGGTFGDTVFAKKVNHPGTEPRLFSETVIKRRRKKFTQSMIQAARVV